MEQYQYYAFISYKRTDSKWADYLYRNLQNYRLPGKLCKKYSGVTKRLCPVFMDKDDLAPGNLNETLKNQIASSKFFISVCSKNALNNPQYIDMELQYFLETHDNDYTKVIPFIVDNSPHPEKECFSPQMQALCEKYEIIGVNVTERGKRRAFLKVVAYMHGLQVSEIESADDIRRRKNKILSSITGVALLCSVIFGISYWWQHIAVHTDYYISCIWENNVASGKGKINKSKLSQYSRYYCFKSVDGRVISVSYQNYANQLVPVSDEKTVLNLGASKIEFTYNGEGNKQLHTAKYYDHKSLPIVCYQYSADGTHVMLLHDEKTGISAYAEQYLGIEEMDDGPRTFMDNIYISRYIQELNDKGQLVRRYYAYGEDYTKLTDGNGIFGYDLKYDVYGNLTEIKYFSTSDASVIGETNGISTVRYAYDDANRIKNVQYFNDEVAVKGIDEWHGKEYVWHKNNNIEKVTYIGIDGKPAVIKSYATTEYSYDSTKLIKATFYDADGAVTACDDGYAFVTYKTDEIGEIISCRYWNADSSPTTDKESGVYGYDIYKQSHNQRYRVCVDQNSSPMLCNDGYAYAYTTYDKYDYPVRIEYRDENNNLRTEPYTTQTYKYDDVYHNIIEWRFFDENNNPIVNPELGYAAAVSQYDNRGFTTLLEYRDENDELCDGPNGYAKVEGSRVLERNYTTETRKFFNKDNEPVINSTINAYGYECSYYENGKMAGFFYLDEKGRPYYDKENKFAGVSYLYDEYGYINYVQYYGANLKNIAVNGFSGMSAVNDEHGNVLSREYYNESGDFAYNEQEGYAGMVAVYENNRRVNVNYFGSDNGKPVSAVNPIEGFAGQKIVYNEDGKITEVLYFGADGSYMNHLYDNYAAIIFNYNEEGQVTGCSKWAVKNGELEQIK